MFPIIALLFSILFPLLSSITTSHPSSCTRKPSRSTLPEGVKTKKWEDRMEKTRKEKAIKLLQAELSEEKKAEITRYVRFAPSPCTSSHNLTD